VRAYDPVSELDPCSCPLLVPRPGSDSLTSLHRWVLRRHHGPRNAFSGLGAHVRLTSLLGTPAQLVGRFSLRGCLMTTIGIPWKLQGTGTDSTPVTLLLDLGPVPRRPKGVFLGLPRPQSLVRTHDRHALPRRCRRRVELDLSASRAEGRRTYRTAAASISRNGRSVLIRTRSFGPRASNAGDVPG
jgi:hypothetical protein